MASRLESNQCSICQKADGECMCDGCKKYFCVKHFDQHRQQLSTKFDVGIVRTHDELFEQINKINPPNTTGSELFGEIDRWETEIYEKVHQAAEKVRHQLTKLLTEGKDTLKNDFEIMTKEIRDRRKELDFNENDIERLQQRLNQIQISVNRLVRSTETKAVIVTNDQINWNRIIYVESNHARTAPLRSSSIDIHPNAKWKQIGVTVAGGNEEGNGINQLNCPWGLYVDDEETVYVAEESNHRIMEWKSGATNGKVIVGGKGNVANQLNHPEDVIIDKERDSLIISDYRNKRVVRWPRRNGTSGEIIISNICCVGLIMDDNGCLYVVDHDKNEVKRFRTGENQGTLVAGGNGQGNRLDQLSDPYYVFVDRDHSV
ncbi:unnamed protein product, partial [Rotaria sp. Silwood1]